MPGIGGTGVVTISAIVQMAAHLDGRWAAGLEQVGLAQKGGPVVSDVRIADAPVTGQLRAASGSVDVVLGFDVLGTCAPETLAVMDPTRTAVVVDSAQVPTAQMVLDPSAFFPSQATTDRRLAAAAKQVVTVDAGWIAERLFADHMPANLVLLGAVVQLGMLPLTARVIEKAITLNGAAVQTSLAAFRWGRASVVDPTAVRAALTPAVPPPIDLADPDLRQLTDALIVDDALRLTIERRAAELRLFQDQRCARRYIAAVADVARIEADRNVGQGLRVTDAFARNLHKLMAYKDEYEVARLHLDAAERTRLESELGPDVRVQVLLDPPILRAFGRKEKLRLGRGAFPLFRGLAAMRRLRGTPLDVFGYSDIRRIERALPNEYVVAVHQALAHLDLTTVDLVIDVAASPDLVRGYEDVKMANVARYRAQIARLLEEMEGLPAQRDLARVATAGGGQRDITG
jgi:indolepyruvate ferredoxin oxidoreductase